MSKRKAIILDIDGCLADSEISHLFEKEIASGDFEWFTSRLESFESFSWSKPFVLSLVNSPWGLDVLFVTARQENYLGETVFWMTKHLGVDISDQKIYLFMRPVGDVQGSSALKKDIYLHKIRQRWDVLFAIDDRPDVIKMWKSVGVPSMLVYNTESKIEDEVRKTFNIT
jgi:hypothetical protein